MSELNFDAVEMDTSLAEEYLKNIKEINSTEGEEEKVISDTPDNTGEKDVGSAEPCSDILVKMANLGEKLKNNAELFAQLDYMIRKIPIDESRIHMDLIIKQFLYWSLNLEENDCVDYLAYFIDVTDTSQLLRLGIAAFALVHHRLVYINATKEMSTICHLFTSLCHEVGLLNVHLILTDQMNESIHPQRSFDVSTGCAGIITERSDLQSALDVFLESTSTAPWSLNHIYVQESIYEDFKATLKVQCYDNCGKDTDNDLFEYGIKLFVLDHFDDDYVTEEHVIKVEAYRTTKELLSFVRNCKPDYVSLWASDIAEANEIAHGAGCQIVWVNDFGTFKGPAEISNSVYQNGFNAYGTVNISKTVLERSNVWKKLNTESRKKILLDTIRNYESAKEIDEDIRDCIKVLKGMLRICGTGFSNVSSGDICVGTKEPVGILHVQNVCHQNHFAKSIASLAYGNTMLVSPENYKTYKKLLDMLIKSGTPVFIDQDEMSKKDAMPIYVKLYYTANFTNIKVIFINYGTIFAN